MNREKLRKLFEEYWYDNQFVKEKMKEINSIDKQIQEGSKSEILIRSKEYETAEITKVIEKKKYIESLFEALPQPHRTVMYMKYVSFLTFDQIADRMNYSTKRIYQLHAEALDTLLVNINSQNQNR